MKLLLFLSLFLVARVTLAQTPVRTQFYFLNGQANGFDYKVSPQVGSGAGMPVYIKGRTYTLITTDADSLSLSTAGEAHRLPYEPGKTYYFAVRTNAQGLGVGYSLVLTEVTERIFWLTAQMDNIKKRTEYFLSKTGDVQQIR